VGRARHIEIRLGVPAFGSTGLLDHGAKNNGFFEIEIIGPDGLGSGEVRFEEGFLRIDPLLGVFGGGRPLAVIEVEGEPFLVDCL